MVSEIKELKEAYALFSPLTNMPYVECEKETYNDQAFLFAAKEDAEKAVQKYQKEGILVAVRELKTVELKMPTKTDKQEEKRIYLNQVRQHLSTLPMIGINAICYRPFGKEAQSMEVSEVLPEGYDKKITDNPFYQPTLQLTGMYLMQEARRKKEFVDRKKLQEMDEEFSSNLVKAKLVVAVVPPEGKEQEQQLDLKECKLPYLKHQSKGNFFPVFTDLWEFQKYAQRRKDLRPIQVPFADVTKFWVEDAKAYMLNPMGFSLPLAKEMVPKILEKFGVSAS